MPNYSYYQGYGPQDGAQHTMAIALTASGIENFSDAPIRVYFYKRPPENIPGTKSVVLSHGVVYIQSQDDALTEKEQRIIETILSSAHQAIDEPSGDMQ